MSLKRKAADIAAADAKKPKVNSSITSFFGPPKTATSKSSQSSTDAASALAPVPAAKFDKDKWVAALGEEQRTLLKLEIGTLHESWLAVLKDEITSKSFLDLKRFLKSEAEAGNKIFPPSEDVYSWYCLFSFSGTDYTADCHHQVTTHTTQHCQGRHPRSGSIP
jgi:uracil-DNA glycosylase